MVVEDEALADCRADIEIFPAFGYGKDEHQTTLLQEQHTLHVAESKVATFHSKDVKLQLDVALEKGESEKSCPTIEFRKEKRDGMVGEGLVARVLLEEGQAISLVLREDLEHHITKDITPLDLDCAIQSYQKLWVVCC